MEGEKDEIYPVFIFFQVMKESTAIEKPHVAENVVQSLMADHIDQEDTITFPKVSVCLQS